MATMIVDERTGYVGSVPTLAGMIADQHECYLDEGQAVATALVDAAHALMVQYRALPEGFAKEAMLRTLTAMFADLGKRYGDDIAWLVRRQAMLRFPANIR